MGTSLYDRYLAETKPAPTAPTSLYDQYIASQKAPQNGAEKLHAEFKRGTLGGRMQRENANDQELAAVEDEAASVPATAGLAALSHGIPGAEALQTFARVGSQLPGGNEAAAMAQHPLPNSTAEPRQSYREAYQDIHGAVDKVPGKTALAIAGSAPLAAVLPGGPAASGALLGGADQLLDANPETGVGERAVAGAVGAAGGALLGKGTEMAVTAGRALIPKLTADPAKKLLKMQAERAASADRLYAAAMKEGQQGAGTAAVQKFLAEPDIAEIVTELQQTRPFAGVAADSPQMLDAVYKTLSDRAQTVKKGLEAVSPNRPNIGRFRGNDIGSAQSDLLTALETPGTKEVVTKAAQPAVTLPAIPRKVVPGTPAQEVPAITTAQSPAPDIRTAIENFHRRPAIAAARNEGTSAQRMAREALERRSAEAEAGGLTGSPGPRTIPATPEEVVFEGMPERTLVPARPAETTNIPTPAAMPSYRAAVVDYAKRTKEMDALRKGYDVMRAKMQGGLPTAKNLTRTTEPAFGEWAAKHTGDVPAATEGVMGAARSALLDSPFTTGRKAVSKAPSLLRSANSPTQSLYDMLTKAGLIGANALRHAHQSRFDRRER